MAGPSGLRTWLLLAGLAGAAILSLSPAQAANQSVTMLAAAFQPTSTTIVEGETVTWVDQQDSQAHTVTSTSNPAAFDSGILPDGGAPFTWRFDSAGDFPYYCQVHGSSMSGTVHVTNVAPTISITQGPADGASVFGGFTLGGVAADAAGSVTVDVSSDGGSTWLGASMAGNTWTSNVDLSSKAHGTLLRVKARVNDGEGPSVETPQRTLVVNAAPEASFTFTPADPVAGAEVQFTDTTVDPDGLHNVSTWQWAWDFGDGGNSSAQNPRHRFVAKGPLVVRLNVSDDHGAWNVASRTVSVANAPPVANFSFLPADPSANETVAFTDASTDPDGDLVATSWSWQFGDGATSTQRNATHAYAAPGSYQVNLTVRDAEERSAALSRTVVVSAFRSARPVANLTANVTRGVAPLQVTFTVGGFDPDGSVANWTLDFGDGLHTEGPGAILAPVFPVEHSYARNGTYLALLTLSDATGTTGTNSTVITVEAPPDRPPIVNFHVSPTAQPAKGQVVRFSDNSTDPDPGDRVERRSWDFGDGTRPDCCNHTQVDHAYARAGRFAATLTAFDTFGAAATLSLTILVPGDPPKVLLGVNSTGGRAPFPAKFTPEARDLDGVIQRWALDFGDGSPVQQGTGGLPANATYAHVYENPGTYTAIFDVTDDDDLSARATVTIAVAVRAPQPLSLPPDALSASPTGERLTYMFRASTSIQGDQTYQWAFGDGAAGAGREVTYSYDAPGTYQVTLTILSRDTPIARGSMTLDVGDFASQGRAAIRSDVANGVLRIGWLPPARAGGFQVWRSVDGGRFEVLATLPDPVASTYSDLSIVDGVLYAYRVTWYSPNGDGRLERLSQLGSSESFRLLGETRALGLRDSDGDGVRDSADAFPLDAARSIAGPGPEIPLLILATAVVAGAGAWHYRQRLGLAPPRAAMPLTDLPGLTPDYAALLRGVGIPHVGALAKADPAEIVRTTVIPRPQVDAWVSMAQLLQIKGLGRRDAVWLVRAGVRGPGELARAEAGVLARRTTSPKPVARVARWIRAAKRHVAAQARS